MAYIGRSPTLGNYQKLDDFSASFNGSTSTFNLTVGGNAFYPASPTSLLVSLGGVVQEPVTSYTIENDQITFTTPPAAATDLFILSLGTSLSIGVPGDLTITPSKLSNGGPSWNSSGDVAISGVTTITTSAGTVSVGVGTTALLVEGNARVTGILTVGTSSITLDGTNNTINVGTGVTINSNSINVGTGVTINSTSINVGTGVTINSTGIDLSQTTLGIALPSGTTAQRPSGTAPYIRKNTTNNALEYYDGTSWVEIITDYFPTGSTILG